jgi:ketosteroid isomerase-like protein
MYLQFSLTCAPFQVYDAVNMRTRFLSGIRPRADLLKPLAGLLSLIVAIGALASPRAQNHVYRHEIEQMEEQWRTAMLSHNSTAMEKLLADDFTGITAVGAIQTRDQIITSLNTGTLQISSLAISERKVRVYGSTAVVTSVAEVTGTKANSELTGRYRYTRVYVRNEQGEWKIVSFEASRIQEPAEHK